MTHIPAGPQPSRGHGTNALVFTGIGAFFAGGLLMLIIALLLAAAGFGSSLAGGFSGSEGSEEYYEALTVGPGGDLATLPSDIGACYEGVISDNGYVVESVGQSVTCTEDHQFEMFAVSTVASDARTEFIAADLDAFAYGLCQFQISQYTGAPYEDSDFEFKSVIPSEQGWRQGDHTVKCLAYDYMGGSLSESVRVS